MFCAFFWRERKLFFLVLKTGQEGDYPMSLLNRAPLCLIRGEIPSRFQFIRQNRVLISSKVAVSHRKQSQNLFSNFLWKCGRILPNSQSKHFECSRLIKVNQWAKTFFFRIWFSNWFFFFLHRLDSIFKTLIWLNISIFSSDSSKFSGKHFRTVSIKHILTSLSFFWFLHILAFDAIFFS